MQTDCESVNTPQVSNTMSDSHERYFDISEESDPLKPEERLFVIKIFVSADMRARMNSFEKAKKERMTKLEMKEKTPEYANCKEKYENYSKMDAKGKDQERRKEGTLKNLSEYENHIISKEKYNFPIFESFENRGRSPFIKYSYSIEKRLITIRISKNYLLNDLHMSHKEIFNAAISFTRTWEIDFYDKVKVLWKLYLQVQKCPHFNVYIRSLDLISVTFDIQYNDKKSYRFRYSPFEFKHVPTFKDQNQLTGYFQNLSCVPDMGNIKPVTINDQDFYTNHRLFFFDDLTDNNIFFKIFNRANLFYQVYSISRSNITNPNNLPELDDFCKKCLGHFYFSTTRLKKFIFTWSFKQYKKPLQKDRKPKDDPNEPKQVILHVPFYYEGQKEQKDIPVGEAYRLKMNVLEYSKLITNAVKEEIAYRCKEWYSLVKECLVNPNKIQQFDTEKSFRKPEIKLELKERPQQQDYEMLLQFGSRQRLDRFFMGLIVIISGVLDRHFFTLSEDRDRKRQETKYVQIETNQTFFSNPKQQYIQHYHYFKISLVHTYYPHMFISTAKKEDRASLDNFLQQNVRNSDYKLKCGEWRFDKLIKLKRKVNVKNEKEPADIDYQNVTNWSQTYRNYINILLKHFPIRIIYKDILHFVEHIAKIGYSGQEETNFFEPNKAEGTYQIIISSLLNYFYYSHLKPKQDKPVCETKEDPRIKLNENEKPPKIREDRSQDSMNKVIILKLLAKNDVGFMIEDKLVAEITFKMMEFRQIWFTTTKEGYIVIRVFEDRIDIEKEYTCIHSIKCDIRHRKPVDNEHLKSGIKAGLDLCLLDRKATLAL